MQLKYLSKSNLKIYKYKSIQINSPNKNKKSAITDKKMCENHTFQKDIRHGCKINSFEMRTNNMIFVSYMNNFILVKIAQMNFIQ